MRIFALIALICVLGFCFSCKQTIPPDQFVTTDTTVQTAGIKMIPIQTPVGNFKVWTKKFGNSESMKVLLLHGGPAMTHEYMECFESFFPAANIEFYEYDQLGSIQINLRIAVCGQPNVL
jgi:proline iminopeptidase